MAHLFLSLYVLVASPTQPPTKRNNNTFLVWDASPFYLGVFVGPAVVCTPYLIKVDQEPDRGSGETSWEYISQPCMALTPKKLN